MAPYGKYWKLRLPYLLDDQYNTYIGKVLYFEIEKV